MFWRYPNFKNVQEIIYKKGYTKIDEKIVPLTDNNIIEQVSSLLILVVIYFYINVLIDRRVWRYWLTGHLPFFFFLQALGKYDILCIEDIVHEIAHVGPHFKEVTRFLGPFILTKPEGALRGSKTVYKDGGDAGNREDQINELINKMN